MSVCLSISFISAVNSAYIAFALSPIYRDNNLVSYTILIIFAIA